MHILDRRIWVVVGTRPEAIKQVPVYLKLCQSFGKENVALIGTGQHEELLNQALKPFGVQLDLNLQIMGRGNSLCDTSSIILKEIGDYIQKYRPIALLVQGDTSTAAMSGLAAFFNKVPVFHNEAGLRSYDIYNPFPEEINRKILTGIASVHLAPTLLAKEALLNEGIKPYSISLTGNSGIDALMMALRKVPSQSTLLLLEKIKSSGMKPVLMTAHRRENAGQGMEEWMETIRKYFTKHADLALVFPLHPNNLARDIADKKLANLQNSFLISPLDYVDCCHVISESHFVVTDSGGIQEEAATLGIPVVVCRKTTERMEAVHAEIAVLAGLDTDKIYEAMEWADQRASETDRTPMNIFGDGHASEAIAKVMLSRITVPVRPSVDIFNENHVSDAMTGIIAPSIKTPKPEDNANIYLNSNLQTR